MSKGDCCEPSEWGDNLLVESDYQLGHDVAIPPYPGGGASFGVGPFADAVWAEFRRPQASTLTFWCDAPGYVVRIAGYVGNARIVKQFAAPTVPTSMQVFGRSITVSFAALLGSGGTNGHAALTPENVDPLGDVGPIWVPATTIVSSGIIYAAGAVNANNGAGKFLSAQGFVSPASAAGTYYLMFFDAAAPPGNNAAPLLAIGPLGPGAPFAFDMSTRPLIRFTTGLVFAMSTTGDLLTNTAAAIARVDAGVGV